MDSLIQVIGDPHRRTLLDALRDGPATVTELADRLPIARPGVSRHLRVLREAGLVDVRSDAQRRIYELRPDPLVELDEWLAPYRDLWLHRMDALHTEVRRGTREARE
jgi:DNA-binding transcriptional ArsR family regulator